MDEDVKRVDMETLRAIAAHHIRREGIKLLAFDQMTQALDELERLRRLEDAHKASVDAPIPYTLTEE
jgi:hypothetical protein